MNVHNDTLKNEPLFSGIFLFAPRLMFKNHCCLFVHISKTLYQQLFLAIKVTVNRPGRNSCQLVDFLDAHALQAILPHNLYCRKNDLRFGVIQSNHSPRNNYFSCRLFTKGLYTNLFFLARVSDCTFPFHSYLFSLPSMLSFKALAALNTGTLCAGISTISLVCGLRPVLAARRPIKKPPCTDCFQSVQGENYSSARSVGKGAVA